MSLRIVKTVQTLLFSTFGLNSLRVHFVAMKKSQQEKKTSLSTVIKTVFLEFKRMQMQCRLYYMLIEAFVEEFEVVNVL